ncbi:ankyrin repeat and fibronectin type-III domain-containing 1 [Schistosoma japonicum]|uniref:Ankyrin repeat and fibronectin type-III domain-containing 1 n=1 Tax=Schistosoma japonicum TaxID=6182 RepID=A0A4Z2DL07_SCHJA|nr:ankyrin repeat and fibronectin type-III domain-containing 1 [Schistosoma japonicum]
MLSTALNFLSDKRKRFHRSDTMPAFTNDSNYLKLTSDNQIINIDKQLNIDKIDDNHSNYNNDEIISTNIHIKNIDNNQDEILLEKNISNQCNLSSSSRSCTFGKLFESNTVNDGYDDDDDEEEEDDYNRNECKTDNEKLTSFVSNDKHLTECNKMSYKEHPSDNNLDKYQFLDLETNLYRHGKNQSNSPVDENIPRRLSHGYSLSNVQVPSDTTSIQSNVSSPFIFSKTVFSDVHHNSKDKQSNHPSKCKKLESTKSLRFPSDLKDSQSVIIVDSNNEQTIDSTTKISGKSKVAKMRARAVARAAKGKLKRSKSSAYMSRHFQESNLNDDNNVRGRSSSVHRNSDVSHKENQTTQHLPENKTRSSLVKNWIDKNPRLRSDISPQSNTNLSNICEVVDINECLEQLVNKANKLKFQVINSLDYTKNTTEITETINKTNNIENNHYHTKMLFNHNFIPSSHTNHKHNRYSVVRKLRRNNSSITCSNDQLTISHEDQNRISTSSTAGDLLLPLKYSKINNFNSKDDNDDDGDNDDNNNHDDHHKDDNNNNDMVKTIIENLFSIIKLNDYDKFIKLLFNYYQKLNDKHKKLIHKATNKFSLTILDNAHLTSSLPIISCLLVCNFLSNSLIQTMLYHNPQNYSFNKIDQMGKHLQNLLNEKQIQLNQCKNETITAIEQVNHLTIIHDDDNNSNSMPIYQQHDEQISNTIVFAEIAIKEKQLQSIQDEYDYLNKLIDNYNKLTKYTKSPNKVKIFLNSSNSILIRISPPRNDQLNENQNVLNNYSNENIPQDIDLDQSSCESTDNELIQDIIHKGRKINDVHRMHPNNIILRYCIEWSTCPKFSNSEVYHCLVQPPFRIIKPDLHVIKSNQLNILRVGFYCLNNLPENKMIFIRVYAFSIHGWSEPCYANPNGIVLSSWSYNKICEQYRATVQREASVSSYTKYVGCTLDEQIDTFKNNLFKQLCSWTRSLSFNSNTAGNVTSSIPVNIVDETGKKTRSPMLQRKRSFRFPFTNKGLKFVKQTKSGVYLAIIYHTPTTSNIATINNESSGKLKGKTKIVLADDYIPILNISRVDYTNESALNSDFNWFSRIVSDSFFDMDLQFLYEDIPNTSLPTNLQLRVRLLEILQRLRLLLGTSNLGIVYPEIIRVRSIDSNLINLKPVKSESSDIQDHISSSKISTETNDSIASTTSYESIMKPTSFLFVLIKKINSPNEIMLTGNLRWCQLDKFLRQNKVKLNKFFQVHSNIEFSNYSIITNMTKNLLLPALYSHLLTTRDNQVFISPESQLIANLDILLGYSERHNHTLDPGLYVVLVQMKAHMDQQAAILISNTPSTIHMLPAEKIRSRSHVSKDEWYGLCRLVENTDEKSEENFINLKYSEKRFIIQLIKATLKLTHRLCYSINDLKMFRIFLPEIIRISPVHAFILLLPPIDQVCLPPTSTTLPPATCSWIPMTYFERHLGISYDPLFHNRIQHLISLLELIIPLSQFAQRQCLTESDLSQISERTHSLQTIQTSLENMYQTKRWLSETISIGRDRKKVYNFHITFKQIVNEYIGILKPYLIKLNLDTLTDETIKFYGISHNDGNTVVINNEKMDKPRSSSVHSGLFNQTDVISEQIDRNTLPCSPTELKHIGRTSVIQVYADYPTGLNPGVSVRLLINIRTTVGEVIETVVKQLLETANRKNIKSSGNNDSPSTLGSFDFTQINVKHNLENHLFCLTVSVGQLERCLPNTVRLALLRRPWRFGKLTIRLLSDLSEDIQYHTTNSNCTDTINPDLPDHIVSPLLTVTFVQPNLKQANINSPPEILQ